MRHKKHQVGLLKRLRNIKFLVTDFDGVWTDNLVFHSQEGKEFVVRSKADSLGIDLLQGEGLYNKNDYLSLNHSLDILILSRESNPIVESISRKVKVKCLTGQHTKVESLYREAEKRGLTLDRVLYIGNDLNDIECMELVGIAVAVADSYPRVSEVADYVTKNYGGRGAVREIIDLILESRK